MDCLYEFEPHTLFPITFDDSDLRVFNSMMEFRNQRSASQIRCGQPDRTVLNVKSISLFSEYPFVETPQTKLCKYRRGLEAEDWDFSLRVNAYGYS